MIFIFMVCFSFAFLLHPTMSYSQSLNLKVQGNEEKGYVINLFDGNDALIKNEGEFSISISNKDYSISKEITNWKGSSYYQAPNGLSLKKELYVEEFDANLSAEVKYRIINPHLIKKTISLYQGSVPNLYYTLSEKNIPAEKPLQYITFEHENFPGGMIHELYPAAGFVTKNKLVTGFLTDPGYKNQFTRTTRRRFGGRGGGMVGMRLLPDPELVSISSNKTNAPNESYIKYTFGEFYDLDRGEYSVYNLTEDYQKKGAVGFEVKDSQMIMNFEDSEKAGIQFLTPLKNQKVYTISFLAKGVVPVSLKLYRIKNGVKKEELEHGIKYIDAFPVNAREWTEFKGSILVPYLENDRILLFLGKTSGDIGELKIKDFKIKEHRPFKEPYNRLPLGDTIKKTTYIFSEPWENHNKFKISSQVKLAEGMGFKGSEVEKLLYADYQMMTWVTSIDDFTSFNVPNMNYSPDMYNRDSFWSTISTYNEVLNRTIWNQWAKTQTADGAIGTIITPYMGSIEVKDNEATIEWLIWALLNKRRFNLELPMDKIKLAADYILNEFDPDRDGICESHFSMSQIDVMEYTPKTDKMAVNQGMFAIALKTIQALGIKIENSYVRKATDEYVKFYDTHRKHLLFDRDYPKLISLTDLIPEFLSLWLFDQPMLEDYMVINHLNQFPVLNKMDNAPHPEIGTTAPIIIRLTNDEKGYSYMDSIYQPFGEFGEKNYGNHQRDGFYYNGGSWLRAEYSAYVVGLKHGWQEAKKRMENRLWAEINLNPNWPYSKEFIPTKWMSYDEWWPSTRGLSWNVFILMANEFAGLRTPEMDPDYRK